jgi:hypothetical protein
MRGLLITKQIQVRKRISKIHWIIIEKELIQLIVMQHLRIINGQIVLGLLRKCYFKLLDLKICIISLG